MMTLKEITELQHNLGLSDTKLAASLGVTRQTLHNWRTGRGFPPLARNALRWMMELHRLSPENASLPKWLDKGR